MALRDIPFSNGSSTDVLTTVSNIQFDTVANKIVSDVVYAPSTPSNWPVVPTSVNGALDTLASSSSIIYLPTFAEGVNANSGSHVFTIGGYSASDTNNGYFCLNNTGSVTGLGISTQSTGFTDGDIIYIVVGNVNTAESRTLGFIPLLVAQQEYTYSFSTPLTFSPTDQLLFTYQFAFAAPVTYVSISLMFRCVITG